MCATRCRELHTACVCARRCFGFPWRAVWCDHCAACRRLARLPLGLARSSRPWVTQAGLGPGTRAASCCGSWSASACACQPGDAVMGTLQHSSAGGMETGSDLPGEGGHCRLCVQIISRKDAHPRPPAHDHLWGKARSCSTVVPAGSAMMPQQCRAASPSSPALHTSSWRVHCSRVGKPCHVPSLQRDSRACLGHPCCLQSRGPC